MAESTQSGPADRPAIGPATRRGWIGATLLVAVLVFLVVETTRIGIGFIARSGGWRDHLGGNFAGVFWGMVLSYGLLAVACGTVARDLLCRDTSRAWSRLRLCVYAAAGLSLYSWLELIPFVRGMFDIAFFLAAGVFAVAIVAGPLVSGAVPRSWLRVVEIVLANVIICVVGAELTLRAFAAVRPSPLLARASNSVLAGLEQARYAPGYMRYGFPCNSVGDYDLEPPSGDDDRPLVVSIGDSFAKGVVPHYFNFTTVAERALDDRVVIYNMGAPAIGIAQYLYLLEYRALPLEPDAVVLNVFIGNDVVSRWEYQGGDSMPRSWFDRDNLLVYLVPTRLATVAQEAAKAKSADGRAFGELQGERASLDGVLTEPDEIIRAFPWVADPFLEESNSSPEGLLRVETGHALSSWSQGDAPYGALYEGLLEARRICGDTPLLVTMIPSHFQCEEDLWQRVLERVPEVADRDFPQRAIGEWLERNGFEYLDYLPAVRRLEPLEDGKLHAFHRDDTHFNARGNRAAGEALGARLGEFLALP